MTCVKFEHDIEKESQSYPLLEATKLSRGQGVRLANDRDHINAWREAAHELDVHLPQTTQQRHTVSVRLPVRLAHSRVAGRRDEVEERMDTVVAEARITLDTRLLGEDVIVLALDVANDLLEAGEE